MYEYIQPVVQPLQYKFSCALRQLALYRLCSLFAANVTEKSMDTILLLDGVNSSLRPLEKLIFYHDLVQITLH
jgi:hypothetical protein